MVFGLFGTRRSTIEVVAPLRGEVQPIANVPDPAFSQKMMGDGFAVVPADGNVVAPVAGEVVTLFPTRHAVGIRTPEGLEVLVHVGIDTVKLNGEGFTALVREGSRVEAGQPIMKVELDAIRGRVPSLATPVVFTNLEGWRFTLTHEGFSEAGQAVAKVAR